MIEKDGDLFTTDATYIGHGVNCKGVMGAGIAKTIKEKFPKVYWEYKQVCKAGLEPGWIFPYAENGKVIVNLATQRMPGPDARYDWVFESLYTWALGASTPERIAKNGNVMALPEIGCGIGGLDWPIVKKILETIEAIFPQIEFEVWHYK